MNNKWLSCGVMNETLLNVISSFSWNKGTNSHGDGNIDGRTFGSYEQHHNFLPQNQELPENGWILSRDVLKFYTSIIRVIVHVLHSCRILYQFYVGFISFMHNNLSQNLNHLFFSSNILWHEKRSIIFWGGWTPWGFGKRSPLL